MADTDGTIHTDVQNSAGFGAEDDGADAFLSSFDDDPKKKGLSDEGEGASETHDEADGDADTNTESEADDEGSDDPDDPDNQEIEIKVGDEIKKAKLRELKRLFGQEAALTQKSQKASADLQTATNGMKLAEEAAARNTTAMTRLLENAQARYKPYADLDMLVLSQRMDTESFEQLRKDAAAAKVDVDFLTQELDGYMREQTTKTQQAHQSAAVECIKVLQDPKTGIENFGKPLYDEMLSFARESGLPDAAQVTNPAALRILHMAMQFARQKTSAASVEDKVKKALDKPKRVLKPGSGPRKADSQKSAMDGLRRNSDDPDAAAAAFMASF